MFGSPLYYIVTTTGKGRQGKGKGVEDLLLLMSEVDLSRQVDLCFIRQEPFAGHQLHTKPDDDSGGRHLTIEHRVLEFFTGENSY